jgi:hypothetical protein
MLRPGFTPSLLLFSAKITNDISLVFFVQIYFFPCTIVSFIFLASKSLTPNWSCKRLPHMESHVS